MTGPSPVRSLEQITVDDLTRLSDLARAAETRLFARNPRGAGLYRGRLLCRALCQGAAAHYLDGVTGVKDFDVWSFYALRNDGPMFPHRWHATADFGPSKFGRWEQDAERYQGRRVDLFGRAIRAPLGDDPLRAIRKYLTTGRSRTVRALAEKPVVVIWPVAYCGLTAWTGRVRGEEF